MKPIKKYSSCEVYTVEDFIELVGNNLVDETGIGFFAHDENTETDVEAELDIEYLELMSEYYEFVCWYKDRD